MTKNEGFVEDGRPICVFCNAKWTDAMIRVYDVDAAHGEGSYDYGPEDQTASVEIICESCHRLIYKKQFNISEDGTMR